MKVILLILILVAVINIISGLFIFVNPVLAFEIQKKFYEKINWRIEPISMQKEMRNTKIMGLFLSAIALFTIVYIFVKVI